MVMAALKGRDQKKAKEPMLKALLSVQKGG